MINKKFLIGFGIVALAVLMSLFLSDLAKMIRPHLSRRHQ